jgi:hypothetical protein
MRVESEVIGDEGEVVVEESLQPATHDGVDHARVAFPEQPVVHDHHLRGAVRGALEEVARGRDAAGDLLDLR